MKFLLNRIKEPSTSAGLGTLFIGIGSCLKGDLGTGVPLIVTSLVAIFAPEKAASQSIR